MKKFVLLNLLLFIIDFYFGQGQIHHEKLYFNGDVEGFAEVKYNCTTFGASALTTQSERVVITGYRYKGISYTGTDLAKQGINFPIDCPECNVKFTASACFHITDPLAPYCTDFSFEFVNFSDQKIVQFPESAQKAHNAYRDSKKISAWEATGHLKNINVTNVSCGFCTLSKIEKAVNVKLDEIAKAKVEEENKIKAQTEAKRKAEIEKKIKLEAELKAKADAEKKALENAEAQRKADADAKAKMEADKQKANQIIKADISIKARETAQQKTKLEAEAKLMAELNAKIEKEKITEIHKSKGDELMTKGTFKDYEGAIIEYEEALKNSPDNIYIKQKLESAQNARKNEWRLLNDRERKNAYVRQAIEFESNKNYSAALMKWHDVELYTEKDNVNGLTYAKEQQRRLEKLVKKENDLKSLARPNQTSLEKKQTELVYNTMALISEIKIPKQDKQFFSLEAGSWINSGFKFSGGVHFVWGAFVGGMGLSYRLSPEYECSLYKYKIDSTLNYGNFGNRYYTDASKWVESEKTTTRMHTISWDALSLGFQLKFAKSMYLYPRFKLSGNMILISGAGEKDWKFTYNPSITLYKAKFHKNHDIGVSVDIRLMDKNPGPGWGTDHSNLYIGNILTRNLTVVSVFYSP